MAFNEVENGSITSPQGFLACGVATGLKQSGDLDMALIYSKRPARAAGAFTANRFAAPPVLYDQELISKGEPVRAVIVNSGNANACTGLRGIADAGHTAEHVAAKLRVARDEVLVSSTGRIGVHLPMDLVLSGVDAAVPALSADGGQRAAAAIMTTDTRPKTVAVKTSVSGCEICIGGMAKGAGMIAPRLSSVAHRRSHATMLAYITTDAAITQEVLDNCLDDSLDRSFNRITIDGDTSTNDSLIALANGAAGNEIISAGSESAVEFAAAFTYVLSKLAREIVLDGEGVTRFVEVAVSGARTREEARRCAEAIANSALCKTAWFGADPNWGRILCAAGYSEAVFDPNRVSLNYGNTPVVRDGVDAGTSEQDLVKAIDKREFRIELNLGAGQHDFTVWTCDMTYDYVKINADYHT